MSKNTTSTVSVELRLILAFFGRGDDELFHCNGFFSGSLPHLSVHDVIAEYHTHVVTKAPI
jgi:hypothetical protein